MDTTTPRTTKPTTEFPTTPPATPPTTPPNSHDTPPNAHYAQSTPPPYPSSDDDLRSASQVLKDAIAGFSKALGQGLTDVGTNVKNEVMTELSDAA
ncbi:MAG: hypothetical protein LBH13_08690, partial [Cellulomonadaceae bacterium]|nr:hypothetical protein [Cellulomonadaceae bacterium]